MFEQGLYMALDASSPLLQSPRSFRRIGPLVAVAVIPFRSPKSIAFCHGRALLYETNI